MFKSIAPYKGIRMKSKFLASAFVIAGSASLSVHAASVGNNASITVPNAAQGFLVLPLSIQLTNSLVFPDLVIPGTDSTGNHSVSVLPNSDGDATVVTYNNANGNPAGPTAGTTPKSGYTNFGNAVATLGAIRITGHGGKNITISVSKPAGSATLAADGYEISLSLPGGFSSGATPSRFAALSGDATDANAESGEHTVMFGGTLTASKDATGSKGVVGQDIDVTVSYR